MPVTKSAEKAMRRDLHRQTVNSVLRSQLRTVLVKAKADPSPTNLSEAFSIIDRAAKKNLIHANKAARLKSSLSQTKPVPASTPQKKKSKSTKKTTKSQKKPSLH